MKWEILIGIAISVFTAIFGIIKFVNEKEKEFKKEFWQKRYENYERVLELTSKIVVSKDISTVREEISEFRQYYWGKLAMIEDQQVCDAMINFEKELQNIEKGKSKTFKNLENMCYYLAISCRNSLNDTWKPVTLNELENKPTNES
ncbi:hypothetical protein [Kordia sp.]|uniref:hypothetical protein n=1 Tax=Kordia sp. TaxID=1965332 RepID=UPI003B5BE8DA